MNRYLTGKSLSLYPDKLVVLIAISRQCKGCWLFYWPRERELIICRKFWRVYCWFRKCFQNYCEVFEDGNRRPCHETKKQMNDQPEPIDQPADIFVLFLHKPIAQVQVTGGTVSMNSLCSNKRSSNRRSSRKVFFTFSLTSRRIHIRYIHTLAIRLFHMAPRWAPNITYQIQQA